MAGVALDCFIFSGAVAFTNEGRHERCSYLSIPGAEAYTVHPLLWWEMTSRKVLSSTLKHGEAWSVLPSGITVEV
jgi:hypothetical protein